MVPSKGDRVCDCMRCSCRLIKSELKISVKTVRYYRQGNGRKAFLRESSKISFSILMIFRSSKLSLGIELSVPQSFLVLSSVVSDLLRWLLKTNLVKTVKFGLRKAEIRICPTGRTYSKFSLHQRFLRIYCSQYLDGNI